jgi:predicted N-acetyltransferase YhbS
MIHFAFHRRSFLNPQFEQLLNSAFSVNDYATSFPHIFSERAGVLIATAAETSGEIRALCAVDSEFWSEPRFLRGACIGSVAVAPNAQGQGLGGALLKWVIEQLLALRLHDFAYLFSQPRSFYEGLGFTAAGTEGLYSFKPKLARGSPSRDHRLIPPCEISLLEPMTRARLWCALERGRKSGESHADWTKFETLCGLSGMHVSWLESNEGHVFAGAFIGKGIDFKGVMHTIFADSDSLAEIFVREFCGDYSELSQQILVAPGLWSSVLTKLLLPSQSQTLCLVRGLEVPTEKCVELISSARIYPRSLFSS